MAAGTVISVLTAIPWDKVVKNAPLVAEAAAKLWGTVCKKKDSAQMDQASVSEEVALSELDLLKVRMLALEDGIKSLQDQLQASLELIKELAEQNTQLVQRVELNRARLIRYGIATVLGGAALVVVIALLLAGR